MTRRQLRENVFQLLFRMEFHGTEELTEQLALFDEEFSQMSEADKDYITEKCKAIIEMIPELDAAINEKTTGWKTTRMGKVDLTLLRLAVYEILKEEEVPTKVAINEAVELAKIYGTDDSKSFVNGVLAKFA